MVIKKEHRITILALFLKDHVTLKTWMLKIQLWITGVNHYFKNVSKFYSFYQINAALVRVRDFFQKQFVLFMDVLGF